MKHFVSRSFASLIIVLFISSCGSSQNVTIDQEATHIRIPLTFSSGIPYVTVEIQDKRIPLKLDLGGFSTISLSDSILRELEVSYSGSRSSSDAFGNNYRARDYVIPEVDIQGLILSNIEGSEHKTYLTPAKAGNGYIGYGLLSKFKSIVIDYPRKQLILSRDASLPVSYSEQMWTTIPFSDKGGVVAPLTIDGQELSFWWDTGANYSIIYPEFANPEKTRQASNARIYTPSRVNFGGKEMKQTEFVVLALTGPGEDGLIGHSFFINHVVLIDFERRMVSVM